MLLDQIDRLTAQIDQLTTRIEAVAAIPAAQIDPTPTGPDADASGAPGLLALDRLDDPRDRTRRSPGIIAEIGLDMTVFPTPGHLVSWAKLSRAPSSPARRAAPAHREGRPLAQGPARRGGRRGRQAPTPSSANATGGIVSRRGKLKALVAIARSILVIIWHLLADPDARYRDLGPITTPAGSIRPQDAQPHPPARSPRLHRHPLPGRLTRPTHQDPPRCLRHE